VNRRSLPERTLNETLSAELGREVVKLDAIPIADGQLIRLTFEGGASSWRQGVRVATRGTLRANNVSAPQLDLWPDTAPPTVEIAFESSDGLLRVYNIWQSGRRPGVESQSHTSGMLVEPLPDGSRRYQCNDIGFTPDFSKLVFRISIT
jgi:hypothetical protein